MQKELKLTDFQLNLLAELIARRQNVQADIDQFTTMCLTSNGHSIAHGEKIDLKDGKLVWTEEEIITAGPETK